jgi:hypothetical protein
LPIYPTVLVRNIVFGLYNIENNFLLVNHLILIGKRSIFYCKTKKLKPYLHIFISIVKNTAMHNSKFNYLFSLIIFNKLNFSAYLSLSSCPFFHSFLNFLPLLYSFFLSFIFPPPYFLIFICSFFVFCLWLSRLHYPKDILQ